LSASGWGVSRSDGRNRRAGPVSKQGMNAPKPHAREFRPRYYEMDRRGELTPAALLNCLEETAFSHCEDSGWDVFRLMNAGIGWVLLRGGLKMARYPRYGSPFIVETWLSSVRLFYGTREYRIWTPDREPLGFARSLWLFYGLERRRPVPVFDEITAAWAPDGTEAGDMGLDGIAAPPTEGEGPARFDVRKSDIDTNGHVNNVRYLEWALEALDAGVASGRFLSCIRGQFKREVTLGCAVRPTIGGRGGAGRFCHAVYAEGAGETFLAAAAESAWTLRPNRESA